MSAPGEVSEGENGAISAATTFRKDEILLMDFMIKAILRGSRDADIQATVSRKPAFASLASKIAKMREKVSK